jgi:predicted O-methyltransferase YrrM
MNCLLSSGAHDRWTEIHRFDLDDLRSKMVSVARENQWDIAANEPRITDREILGSLLQPIDEQADFIQGDNNYAIFYLLGRHFQPKAILEIGSRFGYSLRAFTKGAAYSPEDFRIVSYDAECDGIQTLDIFEHHFREELKIVNLVVHRIDTKPAATLGMPDEFDLAHVDADQSEQGCYHDCRLAWEALRPGGTLVVDDADNRDVEKGFKRFVAEVAKPYQFIPSFRGIYVCTKT